MLHPNGEYILIKVKCEEKVTASGLYLAGTGERFYEGEVVETGKDSVITQYDIKKGDYVIYEKGTNHEVVVDDVLYDLVSVFDIVAKGDK